MRKLQKRTDFTEFTEFAKNYKYEQTMHYCYKTPMTTIITAAKGL
ncbi:hypothetical protein ACFQ0I_04625 [Mariniflexile aquimaris]|uniref:Uncharacterized protein n=1 Tax=Mariniflexile aquimaris TaxID=881009 RepID=A0ABW3BPV7_9FLAO